MRERFAISVNGASTDVRSVEARRCEVNDGTVSEAILIILERFSFLLLTGAVGKASCETEYK